MLGPNLLKSQSSIVVCVWGGGGVGNQLSIFDAESKSAKIPKFYCGVCLGGGEELATNFQFLMLSPHLLKSQSPITVGGGGVHIKERVLLSCNDNGRLSLF